ncbi:MAG TPA: hypothetical protein VD884_13325 [Ohtaekwangia sp.]|nr:hypothetical protein [Ohtaekwangia sp.]
MTNYNGHEITEYPKGTTKEQWDSYAEDVKRHQEFIKNYRFFLDRICNHLSWLDKNAEWAAGDIRIAISREIDKAESMDAPNEPGYYRANND